MPFIKEKIPEAMWWVFGNLSNREDIWGYFGGFITKIPPYLSLTPANPREPMWFYCFVGFLRYEL